jgi:hypothetical protein
MEIRVHNMCLGWCKRVLRGMKLWLNVITCGGVTSTHSRETEPDFGEMGLQSHLRHAAKKCSVNRHQPVLMRCLEPQAYEVWRCVVWWICTEISEEFAVPIITSDESFPDGGDKHSSSTRVTHLCRVYYRASFRNMKVGVASAAPAPQVPIFSVAVATDCSK